MGEKENRNEERNMMNELGTCITFGLVTHKGVTDRPLSVSGSNKLGKRLISYSKSIMNKLSSAQNIE